VAATLQLFNLQGQLLRQEQFDHVNNYCFDLIDLTTAVYSLEIQTAEGNYRQK